MEVLLPKWVMKRYLLLNHELGNKRNKEFTFDDVRNALQKINDDSRIATLFLAELRKAGWLIDKGVSKEDARKRVYQLKHYEEVFDDYVSMMLKNKKG
jgi:uncharacterized protein (DUF488 family)